PSPRRNESAPRNSPRREERHARYSPRRRSPRRSPPRRSPPRRNSPPHRHNRRQSPVEEELHQGPLSRRIMDLQLPAGLKKPPAMDIYDGSTDPVDHIEN
ncbi:hypothetical protein A2U01_0072132, partial [Trifolium medium]|nr:hypothetical protein [Trifolium medium]